MMEKMVKYIFKIHPITRKQITNALNAAFLFLLINESDGNCIFLILYVCEITGYNKKCWVSIKIQVKEGLIDQRNWCIFKVSLAYELKIMHKKRKSDTFVPDFTHKYVRRAGLIL